MTRPSSHTVLTKNHAVSPEKRLLICCARTKMPLAIAEEIRDLAVGPLDWDFLLSKAAENSVTPLLSRQLTAAASDMALPGGTPPSLGSSLKRLSDATRANAMRCLVLIAELNKIMELFRSRGIQAIPYKGPALAAQAYGDVALREFDDLDIVIRQRDMVEANAVMAGLGYRPKFPWTLSPDVSTSLVPGEYSYRDEARRLIVELHTERTLRHFPVPPDLDELAKYLVPVALGSHEVSTFSAEDGLSLLCIHGSKDFWERISWIADIAELVQSQPHLDWDRVYRRAESLKAERMLHIGLALAVGLLDASLPEEILNRVRRDEVAISVASEIEKKHMRGDWLPLSVLGRCRFRRRMVQGAFAGWRYFLRLTVVPAEEDWSMLSLPRSLSPLYIALRPLRLLRKYGGTGRRSPQSPT